MKKLASLLALSALPLVAGCPGTTATPDAGGDMDVPGADVPGTDTPGADVPGLDAPGADVPGLDAPGADVPETDAGCLPVLCEPLAPGCHYEGATECDCGTVVCTPASCDPACARTDYCDLCASAPVCVVRPEDMGRICPTIYMPVCGCDGMTYSNACSLASAGIGMLHDGACDEPAGDCGGATCNATEYCHHAVGCDSADVSCEVRPEICPDIFRPVCGCDGTTYGNACEAAAAGVDVASDGECATTDTCVPACAPGTTCQACRGAGGLVWACIPDGAVC